MNDEIYNLLNEQYNTLKADYVEFIYQHLHDLYEPTGEELFETEEIKKGYYLQFSKPFYYGIDVINYLQYQPKEMDVFVYLGNPTYLSKLSIRRMDLAFLRVLTEKLRLDMDYTFHDESTMRKKYPNLIEKPFPNLKQGFSKGNLEN